MRPQAEYLHVKDLIASGLNDCAISRVTGIPRATVREWRVGRARNGSHRLRLAGLCPICDSVEIDGWWYSYLLGMYLGDGCLARHPRGVYRLRIVLDTRYPMIIAECAAAITAVKGNNAPVGQVQCPGCVDVNAYWKHWICVFPQHGIGMKYLRKIEMTDWQDSVVRRWPERLLRGLIQSDGCRVINRVKNTGYPRYMFTNNSDDIRGIFCRACDLYGVAWRQSNWKTISVARRLDVAKLDLVIGPKSAPTEIHRPNDRRLTSYKLL